MNRREAIAALMSLPATATVSKASVKTSDVIVIESEHALSCEQIERMQATLKTVWPDNKILVMDRGLKFRIAEHA